MYNTTFLKPSEIRFSQDSIAGRFQNGESVNGAIELIKAHLLLPHDFPLIQVWFTRDGKKYSSDNRRLYVFRVCECLGLLSKIEVKKTSYIKVRKFTTENLGISVRMRGGFIYPHYQRDWLQPSNDGKLQRALSSHSILRSASHHPSRPETNSNRSVTSSASLRANPFSTTSMDSLRRALDVPTISSVRQVVGTASRTSTATQYATPSRESTEKTPQRRYQQVRSAETSTSRAQSQVLTSRSKKDADEPTELERAVEYSRNLMRRITPRLAMNDNGNEYFYDEDFTDVSVDQEDLGGRVKRYEQKRMMYWRLKKFLESF